MLSFLYSQRDLVPTSISALACDYNYHVCLHISFVPPSFSTIVDMELRLNSCLCNELITLTLISHMINVCQALC